MKIKGRTKRAVRNQRFENQGVEKKPMTRDGVWGGNQLTYFSAFQLFKQKTQLYQSAHGQTSFGARAPCSLHVKRHMRQTQFLVGVGASSFPRTRVSNRWSAQFGNGLSRNPKSTLPVCLRGWACHYKKIKRLKLTGRTKRAVRNQRFEDGLKIRGLKDQ